MEMGNITSTNSMSSMQMITAASTDPKIKNIQNEITNTKQQMQKLSSKEELSVNEKANERKKLQKEISRLHTELEQQQEELRKSQKRENMIAGLQEDKELTKKEKSEDKTQSKERVFGKADEKNLPTDKQQTERQETVTAPKSDGAVILKKELNQDENRGVETEKKQADEPKEEGIAEKEIKTIESDIDTDASLSHKEMYAIVSADSSIQQADLQGTIITKTQDGIAILKGEINQDEKRDVNTEKKLAELEKMDKKEQRAIAFQSSILGEANNTMKSAAATNVAEKKDRTRTNAENNAYINALKVSQEKGQAEQQKFFVSFV